MVCQTVNLCLYALQAEKRGRSVRPFHQALLNWGKSQKVEGTFINPALAQTVLGALIGGVSVWLMQKREQRIARRGAGRALTVELLNNCYAIKAFAITVAQNPGSTIGPGIFPKITRNTFDQDLPLIASLLRFDDLRRVALPYSVGYGPYTMLDAVVSARPQVLDQIGLNVVNQTSIMFLDALEVLSKKVLTKRERAKFDNEGIL